MLPGSPVNASKAKSDVLPERRVRAGKISVCHVASGDRWAGAEVQLATLFRAFAHSDRFRLTVISLNEGRLAEEARRCGIEVKIIPESKKSFLQIFSEAVEYVQDKGICILHSHRYKENLLAALLAWRCRVPFVVRTQHGMPEPFAGLKRCKQGVIQLMDQIVARYATDRVISVSAELTSHLRGYLKPEKVVTIHNGIDVDQVRSKMGHLEAKRCLGIPDHCWAIGTAGRLEPVKRLDIFLASAEHVATRLPNTRFIIAGSGSEESRLRTLAHASGLGDRVLFLGDRQDIYDVLRALDIFLLCSDHEGLPMILLEALALGAAVVARSVGGIHEVIQDGVNGILVQSDEPSTLAQACLNILADQARRQRLAVAGANLVASKFTVERTAKELAKLYCSLWEIR